VLAVRSELRLQALDFWLRNPDYLADELLTEVEAGRLNASYVDVASALLDDPEPSLRHYPDAAVAVRRLRATGRRVRAP
jgi:hypothetical protein